ncbi:hypothetical protein GMMP1_120039 [Candidatus Magnetomoraceae bacterium gMMP-1]
MERVQKVVMGSYLNLLNIESSISNLFKKSIMELEFTTNIVFSFA